jgi:hypothetical protein
MCCGLDFYTIDGILFFFLIMPSHVVLDCLQSSRSELFARVPFSSPVLHRYLSNFKVIFSCFFKFIFVYRNGGQAME